MSERRLFTIHVDFLTPWSITQEDVESVLEFIKSVIKRFFPTHEKLSVIEINENTVFTTYMMNFRTICTSEAAEKFRGYFDPPQNILASHNAKIEILHSSYSI